MIERESPPGVVSTVREGPAHRLADALLPHLTIALLTGLAYANSIDASFHYDDVHVVVENHGIRGLRAFLDYLPYQMNRPILAFTFMLNYAAGGLDPAGYRIVNICLHALNASLFYRWAKGLAARWVPIRGRRPFDAEKIAWMASLLFAVHPIATEAVTYVSSRSSVLSTTFCLLCLACVDEAMWRGAGGSPRPPSEGAGRVGTRGAGWPWRIGAVLFFLAAMGTKEIAASLPAILVAYDAVLVRPRLGGFRSRLARFHAVFFFLFGFAFLVRALSTSGFDVPPPGLNAVQYWMSEARALVEYVRLVALPTNLSVDPGFPASLRLDARVVAASLALAVIAAGAVRLAGPAPLVSFGVLFFLLAHAPTCLIPLQDLVADRRDYLPSLGLLLAAAWAFFALSRAAIGKSGGAGRRAVALVSFLLWAAVLGSLTIGTIRRNADWLTPTTLWRDAARKAPGKARPHSNLASALGKSGDVEGALAQYDAALRVDPNYADAHLNLGTLLVGLRRYEEAEAHLRAAARLKPERPAARNRMGELYMGKGRPERAVEILRGVTLGATADPETYYLLGLAHSRLGEMKEAEATWQDGSHRWPNDGRLHRSLGLLFHQTGRERDALRELREAVRVDPSERIAGSALRELEAGRAITTP